MIVINNETGPYIGLFLNKGVYCRRVTPEYDTRYVHTDFKLMDDGEAINDVDLYNTPLSNVPGVMIQTNAGHLIKAEIYVDEETISVEELLIEKQTGYIGSLTSYFTGSQLQDVTCHNLKSETIDDETINVFNFGDKALTIWSISPTDTNNWIINLETTFRKNHRIAGELHDFRIIGEEIVDGNSKDQKIINFVFRAVVTGGEKNPVMQCQIWFMRIFVDTKDKTFESYSPVVLNNDNRNKHENELK